MKSSNYKILVVEDEPTLRMAIQKKLEKSGYLVTAVASAEDGLNLLKTNSYVPSIIWLDYYLPGMNGLDFLIKVKDNPALKNVPVFVISNTAGPEKVANMIAIGVNKYFIKAEKRLDEIIKEIDKLLGEKSE
jgi:CheY-like chemotaxis protein